MSSKVEGIYGHNRCTSFHRFQLWDCVLNIETITWHLRTGALGRLPVHKTTQNPGPIERQYFFQTWDTFRVLRKTPVQSIFYYVIAERRVKVPYKSFKPPSKKGLFNSLLKYAIHPLGYLHILYICMSIAAYGNLLLPNTLTEHLDQQHAYSLLTTGTNIYGTSNTVNYLKLLMTVPRQGTILTIPPYQQWRWGRGW